MRERGLFYKLTAENENAATELLCNLCWYDAYRELILDALGLHGFSINFADIQTQQAISGGKMPDIKIENNNILAYIENKVNKNYRLLKSQQYLYPRDLRRANKAVRLLFLLPEGYRHTGPERMKRQYDFVSTVSWKDLLGRLEAYNRDRRSELLEEAILFFNKILQSLPKIPFTQEDILFMNNIEHFRSEINTMAKETALFAAVIEKLKEKLHLGFGQKEPSLDCAPDAFGYYFCKEGAFLGYSFALLDSGQAEKEFALSLAIHAESIRPQKIKSYDKHPYLPDGDWYYFKINPAIFSAEEKETLLFDFCREILGDLLKE